MLKIWLPLEGRHECFPRRASITTIIFRYSYNYYHLHHAQGARSSCCRIITDVAYRHKVAGRWNFAAAVITILTNY